MFSLDRLAPVPLIMGHLLTAHLDKMSADREVFG